MGGGGAGGRRLGIRLKGWRGAGGGVCSSEKGSDMEAARYAAERFEGMRTWSVWTPVNSAAPAFIYQPRARAMPPAPPPLYQHHEHQRISDRSGSRRVTSGGVGGGRAACSSAIARAARGRSWRVLQPWEALLSADSLMQAFAVSPRQSPMEEVSPRQSPVEEMVFNKTKKFLKL